MGRLLRYGVRLGLRQGWRRGVLGNNRAFLVVGGVALVTWPAGCSAASPTSSSLRSCCPGRPSGSRTSRRPDHAAATRRGGEGDDRNVKVLLRNPNRTLDVDGPLRVQALLTRLEVNRESVLVIADGTLVTGDAVLGPDTTVEIRPVISGGMA
jgi:sulfur carrier protein